MSNTIPNLKEKDKSVATKEGKFVTDWENAADF